MDSPDDTLLHSKKSSALGARTIMQPRRTARHHKYENDADLPSGLRALQLSAWRIVYRDERKDWSKIVLTLFNGLDFRLKSFAAALKNIRGSTISRYVRDVYRAAPGSIIWYLCINCAMSLHSALELQTSNQLLSAIEGVLRGGGSTDSRQKIVHAILMRLFIMNFRSLCYRASANVTPLLDERINTSFKSRLIKAHLGLDMLSAQDRSNAPGNFSPNVASEAFHGYVNLAQSLLSSISQLSVLARIMKKQKGGMAIVGLSVLSPILSWVNTQGLWKMLAVLYINDPWALRAQAMFQLANKPEYHEEIVSYGLNRYISSEYEQATRHSPLSYESKPHLAFQSHRSLVTDVVQSMTGDLPMIYFATRVAMNPKSFSLSTLVLLTQMSQTMGSVLLSLVLQNSHLSQYTNGVKKLYAGIDMRPSIKFETGDTPYPPPGEEKNIGMHIELRYVRS
ncbi:hypothetical protein BDY19DRAFT_314804 [Irpex rosettiformis]|uniref:Uncharacterized protein n=1 Tax=Irpex rosettiformis TaxID=378272 RepID=A0ACB8TYE8_9APHY|nr:hypothetical protein BDY19DRAFT_314804 [Irpex rosettiformis]